MQIIWLGIGTALKRCLLISTLGVVAGCASHYKKMIEPPHITEVTPVQKALLDLPPPHHRIAVSVYNFADLTGQYKDTANVQSLSRAVTQGGTSLLVKALDEAGNRRWFTVLERNRLNDILKERQIITQMRKIYRDEAKINPGVLPPLMHAGILIEGGITGYDTNVETGGVGAEYLGINAHTQYVKNTVYVNLRAVSVRTGEVLAAINTDKRILSYQIQGSIFRYVELDKLFQAEAGTTYNEPTQIAVQDAIDKAVMTLVVRGSQLGLWHFADRKTERKYIADYLAQEYGPNPTANEETPRRPLTRNAVMTPVTYPLQKNSTPAASGQQSPPGMVPGEQPLG